jgi:hypothetical protein
MSGTIFYIALLNIASLLYLAFTVALILGIAEHDRIKDIATATLRRWVKLVGALGVLGIFIHIVSGYY